MQWFHQGLGGLLLLTSVLSGFAALSLPIQLIQPASDHEHLVLNQTALEQLQSLTKDVAVVAVVGPMHSGKSFLLNQLLEQQRGFELGPTVEPKTQGLWMRIDEQPSHLGTEQRTATLVVLDTEGFFAPGVKDTYDAKIFAIATLMSSLVIYNTVKIIDQGAIDFLELLARQAQLFAVKAGLTNTAPDLNVVNVPFPPLLWVVEDFVQDIPDGDADKWIHGLLKHRKRDQALTNTVLAENAMESIFPAIMCHTLPLPSGRSGALRNLDTVAEEDLLPEYRTQRDELRNRVYAHLRTKTYGRGATEATMKGFALAHIVQFLVDAANNASFPTVPSVWTSFLANQQSSAKELALRSYRETMASALGEPVSNAELEAMHKRHRESARSTLRQLLFGLDHLVDTAMAPFDTSLVSELRRFQEGNDRKAQYKVESACDRIQESMETQLQLPHQPLRKSELGRRSKVTRDVAHEELSAVVGLLSDLSCVRREAEKCRKAIDGIISRVTNENTQRVSNVHRDVLRRAVTTYTRTFMEEVPRLGLEAIPVEELRRAHDRCQSDAHSLFEHELAVFREEESALFSGTEHQMGVEIASLFRERMNTNDAQIETMANVLVVKNILECFEIEESARRDTIMNQAKLLTMMDEIEQDCSLPQLERVDSFVSHPLMQKAIRTMRKIVKEKKENWRKRNVELFNVEVSDALERARNSVETQLTYYFVPFLARWRARQIVMAELAADAAFAKRSDLLTDDMILAAAEDFVVKHIDMDAIRGRLIIALSIVVSSIIVIFFLGMAVARAVLLQHLILGCILSASWTIGCVILDLFMEHLVAHASSYVVGALALLGGISVLSIPLWVRSVTQWTILWGMGLIASWYFFLPLVFPLGLFALGSFCLLTVIWSLLCIRARINGGQMSVWMKPRGIWTWEGCVDLDDGMGGLLSIVENVHGESYRYFIYASSDEMIQQSRANHLSAWMTWTPTGTRRLHIRVSAV